MFKRFRIAILLYILVFVALGQYLTARRTTDWQEPLWVDVFVLNPARSDSTRGYIDSLEPDSFAAVEQFFQRQSARYGVTLEQPFRIRITDELEDMPPQLAQPSSLLGTMIWSLKMRWYLTRLHASRDGPAPDITVFAVYHDGGFSGALDRSTALRKGMFAIANLYASRAERGSNQMIVAHELLHTLGATDKYDLASTLPIHPNGYAEPDRTPLYPQSAAELMGGRIPIASNEAIIPRSLGQVMIGPVTASEIGWSE